MYYDSMLLPAPEDCAAMYYHAQPCDAAHCKDGALYLKAGCKAAFDAYYNLFPLQVYREFTVCCEPALCVRVKGEGTISLIACDENGSIAAEARTDFRAGEPAQVCLRLSELPGNACVLYWSCTAIADCVLHGAKLTFAEPVQQNVTLAVGICTYRREQFVRRNAERILALFERIPEESHCLFIADNGSTVSGILPETEKIKIFDNPNTGGSGGFARVMQEVLRCGGAYTHLLLMDDDVDFRPEILQRIQFFLSHCREEFRHVTVGGAMCLLDTPWHQFEAGAKVLEGGVLQGLQMDLDLRDAEQCIRNASAPQTADYNSWWCCCMSVERIRKAGLPMPFFFKMDDVEYALRLGQKTVCLPGVCVAHESFVKKYNPALEYYIVRNTLITCALHDRGNGPIQAVKQLFSAVLRNVMLQRYDTAELILRAYLDFLKGADFLKNTDAAALHREILGGAPKMEPAKAGTHLDVPSTVPAAMRILSLGGLLLPAGKKTAVVHVLHAASAQAFRALRIVHYNPFSQTQYCTELKRSRAFGLLWRVCLTAGQFLIRYKAAKKSYQRNRVFLRGEQFWRKYNGNSRIL